MVVWIREFLIDRSQRGRIGRHYSEEFRVPSFVTLGIVLGPLLFIAYVNYMWRNIESKMRYFADVCIIYREILNIKYVEMLKTYLNIFGDFLGDQKFLKLGVPDIWESSYKMT